VKELEKSKNLHDLHKWLYQKLKHLLRESHHHMIILHTKKEERLFKFPLLFGIILFLLFPIFAGIALVIYLYYEGNLIVEREGQ